MSLLNQLRKGSTPMLILNLLVEREMYGYEIMRELERRSGQYFSMNASLLYPTLHKLERDGFLESEWRSPAGSRRRKYYQVTQRGRQRLAKDRAAWETFIQRMQQSLDAPQIELQERAS